jgi:hypothetical protein
LDKYETEIEKAFKTEQEVTYIREVKKPIIHETIKRVIIEEVQPVIYKTTIVPHVVKQTLPIHEKIIDSPVFTKEVQGIMKETDFDEKTLLSLIRENNMNLPNA